ncbi:RNA polymerase sigma factor [Planctomycetota bacterium]
MGSVPPDAGRFATTRWSVVLAAGSPSSPHYEQALGTLCETYWFPLYAYLRRRGYDMHQAEDAIQAFFARLLEKNGLHRAQQNRGRFRSFLLASLKNILADEWDRAQAQKRGGQSKVLSLDVATAETRYSFESTDRLSPEKVFERSWALTVLKQAMDQLKTESAAADKIQLFEYLKATLAGDKNSVSYKEVAVKLNMSEGAVKAAVYRLRRRYRELVRQEVSQTVATEEQIEEEIRDLFVSLAR